MAQRKTLTLEQVELLGWVGEGCPEGVHEGVHHRISVAALARRGLATTSGGGETWAAEIAPAGVEYLERVAGPNPPIPRQSSRPVSDELVADVIAAGGSLVVSGRSGAGADYERRVRAARREGRVPAGKDLVVTPLGWPDLRIDLVDRTGRFEGEPEASAVPVPETIGRYHPAVRKFREHISEHRISRASASRALRILHALALEAERRGYEVGIERSEPRSNTRGRAAETGKLRITLDGLDTVIDIFEEGLQDRSRWANANLDYSQRTRRASQYAGQYEANATGRLTVSVPQDRHEGGRTRQWSDRSRWRVEDKLPDLLHEVEVRAAEHRLRLEARERERADRQTAWRVAMDRAKVLHAEHHRTEALLKQVEHWDTAQRIRSYCDAVEAVRPVDEETAAWVTWARSHADRIDPLRRGPTAPEPVEPAPGDLKPFLGRWNLHGPESHW